MIRGLSAEVPGRPFSSEEHRARAPADAVPRDLDGKTDGAAPCLTVKTACQKLFPVSRSMFPELLLLVPSQYAHIEKAMCMMSRAA